MFIQSVIAINTPADNKFIIETLTYKVIVGILPTAVNHISIPSQSNTITSESLKQTILQQASETNNNSPLKVALPTLQSASNSDSSGSLPTSPPHSSSSSSTSFTVGMFFAGVAVAIFIIAAIVYGYVRYKNTKNRANQNNNAHIIDSEMQIHRNPATINNETNTSINLEGK